MYCDNPYSFRFHIMIQFIMYLSRDLFIFIQNYRQPTMADEIKAEYKRLQEKKRPKKDDTLEVDEFEWIQVEINCPYFCPTAPPEITQLNKELAVNRDTGKKHSGEAPSEKLVRKFKENPFLPIGGRLAPKKRI